MFFQSMSDIRYDCIVHCKSKDTKVPIIINTIVSMDTLAKRLKQARKESGMSQDELASKCGMTRGGIGHLETGRRDGTTNIAQIAYALGVNALWLIDGKGPKYPGHLDATMSISEEDGKESASLDLRFNLPKNADFVADNKMDYVVPNNPSGLTAELQSRIVPPHIETAIMALLQTCEKRGAKPTQNSQMFSVEEQRKNIEALRQKLTPEQLRDFDGWLESLRSNNVGGLPSSSVYIAGADPKPAALPKGRTA